MKVIKTGLRKGMAVLSATALMVGLISTFPGNMLHVMAADENNESMPSVTTYATPQELMSVFDLDGSEDTVGKIALGKDESDNPIEWYIVGKDTGVLGDNITVFATAPIALNQVFQDENAIIGYDPSFGCGYTEDFAPLFVNQNHYGTSDLREKLGLLATNVDNFTSAEQSIIQTTTVANYDTKSSKDYTTSDKLYALKGFLESGDDTTLWAGSSDNMPIASSIYWNSGEKFWLRTHDADGANHVLYADVTGPYVNTTNDFMNPTNCQSTFAIRPATNFNLESVLFASSASAATSNTAMGTITEGTAMKLRLDGSNFAMGSVVCDVQTGLILVEKDSQATETIALVVQGNDGTNDWYYSKVIGSKEVIKASDIKTELGLSMDVNLSNSKVWLEMTTDSVAYAKNATSGNVTLVDNVEITMDAPSAGVALPTNATTSTNGLTTTSPTVCWKIADSDDEVSGNAEYNTIYYVNITLDVADNALFASTVSATINGNQATSVAKNTDGTITVTYTFPITSLKTMEYQVTGYESTYDGQMHGITVSVSEPADATITYSTDGTSYDTVSPQYMDAGTYTVYYKVEKANYTTVTGSETVVILQQELTVTVEDQTITEGETLGNSKYWVEGLIVGDNVDSVMLTPSTSQVTDNGTITVSNVNVHNSSGIDVTGNYNITCIAGKLVIKAAEPIIYQISNGASTTWNVTDHGDIIITGNGEFEKFVGVKVDGTFIDETNYTAISGSTIINLKNSYLQTLPQGTHLFEMVWEDGIASTTFTVNDVTDDKTTDNNTNEEDSESDDAEENTSQTQNTPVPNTGDGSPIGVSVTLVLISTFVAFVSWKKRQIVKE